MSVPVSNPTPMQSFSPFDQSGLVPTCNKHTHPSGGVPLGRGSDLTPAIPTKSGSPVIFYFMIWPENIICVGLLATPT